MQHLLRNFKDNKKYDLPAFPNIHNFPVNLAKNSKLQS